MNKACREYISDAKKFFPVMGRKERDYLRKVSGDIEDFIEAENITTKSELIEKYHQPYEVANNYYATFFDTELIIKRIKISKYVKLFISVIIALMIIVSAVFVIDAYYLRESYKREEMVGYNQTNTNIYEDKNKDHDVHQGDNYDSLIASEDEEIIEEDEIIQ